ncbi:geranylgeranyl pyrophosphate synthetase [Penicillium daleae]|uniref:Geranylgeranyl pyrophosphate synthetase n=1 Tax=Penicillium daleae TaxID=63821 RepID=A0AAD6CH87_9EURO|nr:geranylgeranyl pyrophosphate synthetase [Penicillium daleae]KAJ5465257.1 geranylgeranyl pyrophosphate synthetase [Penicillium daleae]
MPEPKTASEELVEISRLCLDSFAPAKAIITDVKHLASYNWVEASTPTIAVPGSPARWSAPQGPRRVKKDSGLVYIAQNVARHPDSPLEPLFRSLYIEQPLFDISSIDVVTDRNNIRKLLSFIKPTLTKNGLDPFTIQVDMAAQTAIFCRDETATYEVIGPGEFRGFGHEFEKAYTIPQVRDSTGHHRIISYRSRWCEFSRAP